MRRSNGRWVAVEVERSGGGGSHGGSNDDDSGDDRRRGGAPTTAGDDMAAGAGATIERQRTLMFARMPASSWPVSEQYSV